MRAGRILAWALLWLAVLLTVFPFYWMVRTSLTDNDTVYASNGSLVPPGLTLSNFARVLGLTDLSSAQAAGGSGAKVNFLVYLRNSVIFTALIVVGQTLCCAMAGYALARLRFRGRELVFSVFVGSLMVPPILTLLPNFTMVKSLGLLNTFAGLVAPTMLMTPFAVFFLRQFFLSTPREVEEAARIDGAGTWMVFWRVVLPMNVGPLLTIGLTTAVWTWKDYLWPLLVGPKDDTRVLTAALGIFLQQQPTAHPDWTGLMAASTLTVVPVLILLLLFGRRLVAALDFTGVTPRKGAST
ncbi:carbohydrate ABC transporter permease [Actinocrispum wychmicini]|uniref:Multiple sugar transport system permease protein n=1 Tax=Actinocrispum wychmicini TaxID=1213861 RepID=A0A4R2J970_9PSEU|nr:carbohydrate ABC transporter permease [Actinocrispum wychmicini]TCO54322.1 multiple sugar transport system permease protein [Actinocrispum wychmicini]